MSDTVWNYLTYGFFVYLTFILLSTAFFCWLAARAFARIKAKQAKIEADCRDIEDKCRQIDQNITRGVRVKPTFTLVK